MLLQVCSCLCQIVHMSWVRTCANEKLLKARIFCGDFRHIPSNGDRQQSPKADVAARQYAQKLRA